MKHWIPRYLLTGLIACGILAFSTMAFGGKWEEKATFPQLGAIAGGAWLLGAEAVDGKIYIFGGQDDLQPAGKLAHVYDPRSRRMDQTQEMAEGQISVKQYCDKREDLRRWRNRG